MWIEVAYVKPEHQYLLGLEVPAETTVEKALEISGIMSECPEIDLSCNPVGIFSKRCKLEQTLNGGDRIEIYRPLIADPKEVRKIRAKAL